MILFLIGGLQHPPRTAECSVVEGTPDDVFRTFVMTVVVQEDSSRAVWPSCPALGWTGGVDRLTSIPNGRVLTTPKNGTPVETHGPYQHGGGFPAVNGDAVFEPVDGGMHGGMPITLGGPPRPVQQGGKDGGGGGAARGWAGTYRGLGQPSVFASEFGASVYSSFESMSPCIAREHWSIHGGAKGDRCQSGQNPSSTATGRYRCNGTNAMSQRNYPCDNIIAEYFGPSDFGTASEQGFKKQLWQCMIGQALLIKSDIETRRSGNQFGIIVWQLNEIWPTGGWGSLEYGTVGHTKGQVLGGRWKPLQHWYRATIYADVTATCGNAGGGGGGGGEGPFVACYVKNDSPLPFRGTVHVSSVKFATGASTLVKKLTLDMPAGAGTTQWFTLGGAHPVTVDGASELLMVVVADSRGAVKSTNPVGFARPKDMALPRASVAFHVGEQQAIARGGTVPVTLTTDAFALYVTLTTLAQGRFEDNAFVMLPGKRVVQFIPFEGFDLAQLKSSIRVEHAATYI